MNRSQTKSSSHASYVQIALILGAMLAGAVVTRMLPEVRPMAAYLPPAKFIPTTAVFKHASAQEATHDASRDLTGIDVDVRRLALLGCIA
jgi:hypothetical protein